MKFDVVVGNPPYQEITAKKNSKNGQKTVKNIFQYFQELADQIGEVSDLIYPGERWLHGSGKGLASFGRDLLNSDDLVQVEFFPNANDVFNSVSFTDGVTIVLKNKNHKANQFDYLYTTEGISRGRIVEHPGDDLLVLNPSDVPLMDKVAKFIHEKKLSKLADRILPRSLFSIDSDFIAKQSESIQRYTGQTFDINKSVKLLTNDKAGAAGRADWFIVNRDAIKTNQDLIEEWQVVVSSAHPGGQDNRDNQLSIIDNQSVFGRSRVALGTFKTKIDAENFRNFIASNFVKYTLLMTTEKLGSVGKKVPDLGVYSGPTSLIDFSQNIDEQIFDLVGLTSDERNYLSNVVMNATPRGRQ